MSRKHLVGAVVAGLALRLFFAWRFPYSAGDTRIYEELARNWLDHGVLGLWIEGRLVPVDIRVPGYPAFLAAVYATLDRTQEAVMVVQAALDVVTCVLTAMLAARWAAGPQRKRIATVALWLAALCPFTANYTATPLTETLATLLTVAALLLCSSGLWFPAGLVVGLGTMVRPEAPLLLAAVALALALLAVVSRRRADWTRLIRICLLMAAGLVPVLIPWGVRNRITLGQWQFLTPRYAELPQEYVPRGFYAWTKTWLTRFSDVYLVPWKLEDEPIPIETINPVAFDSEQERARVADLLERYNTTLTMTPDLDQEFARLSSERTARHPLRTYLWVPLARAATMWFTPRIELLPYKGESWKDDPADFTVTLLFGLLNFFYVGLALAGVWRFRRAPEILMPVTFLLVRTAMLTQVEAPEPRYVLVCFPAVLALGALAFGDLAIWRFGDHQITKSPSH